MTGLDWLDKVHSFLECAVNVSDGAHPRILILWGAFALCGLICTKSFLIFDFPGNGSWQRKWKNPPPLPCLWHHSISSKCHFS